MHTATFICLHLFAPSLYKMKLQIAKLFIGQAHSRLFAGVRSSGLSVVTPIKCGGFCFDEIMPGQSRKVTFQRLTWGQIQSSKFISPETRPQPSLTSPPPKNARSSLTAAQIWNQCATLTNFWHDLNRVDLAPPGWGRSSLEVRMVHLSLFWCTSNIPDIYFSFVYTHVFSPSDPR